MGFCRPTSVIEGSIVGTPVHMPPEIFTRNYNQAVDIYAFGILLWYLLRNTCKLPNNFEMCSDKEQLWRKVLNGQRPEKIRGIDQ
jgi:receptor-interacting serine/threonine-protein kinase 5